MVITNIGVAARSVFISCECVCVMDVRDRAAAEIELGTVGDNEIFLVYI